MELIHKNPFRILGLPITASEKEIAKRVSDLATYAELEKNKAYDTDFLFLSPLHRTPEAIQEASRQIEHPEHKMLYSLYWFWVNNNADKLALDVLKDGNVEKAMTIWQNAIGTKELSSKNYSCAKNLATLFLAKGAIMNALDLYGKYFSADMFETFSTLVLPGKTTISRDKICISFLEEINKAVKDKIGKPDGIGLKSYILSLSAFPPEARQSIYRGYAQRYEDAIEEALKKSEQERKSSPFNAFKVGEELSESTKQILKCLKEIYTDKDPFYQSHADKVADELLQCSTSYFNAKLKITESDYYVDNALKLSHLANDIACSAQIKEKLKDDLSFLEKLIARRSLRKCQNAIEEALTKSEQERKNSPLNAFKVGEELSESTKQNLELFKNTVTDKDPFYQSLVDEVAKELRECSITYFNASQKKNQYDDYSENALQLVRLANTIAVSDQAKKILSEDLEYLEQWVAEKPARERKERIGKNIQFVVVRLNALPDAEAINSLQQVEGLPELARQLILTCQPKLEEIKAWIGSNDEEYVKLSSAVVNASLWLCIKFSNSVHRYSMVMDVMEQIGSLDMTPEIRKTYSENYQILKNNIAGQKLESSFVTSQGRGCFIATMVYGNYDAPEVIVLRKFRDAVLCKHYLGRFIVTIYYRLSPTLVKHFHNSKHIKGSLRIILDQIVRILR